MMKWISHIRGGPKRVNHAAVAVGSKIYSFGGYCQDKTADSKYMDVYILDTKRFRWVKPPVSEVKKFNCNLYGEIVPPNRYGHSAVVYGDKVYIWGGRNKELSQSCTSLLCFDTTWVSWHTVQVSGQVPSPRDGHSACVWKNFMYIIGGYEEAGNAFARGIYTLDLDNMHWRLIKTHGEILRCRDFHTTVCIGDRIYLFGGREVESGRSLFTRDSETYNNDVWYLECRTSCWNIAITSGEPPVGRRSHAAFTNNNKMYIFGGYNPHKEEHYNDLYEYDPDSYTWKSLHPGGEKPSERRRAVCISVGTKVFLFGGAGPKPIGKEPPFDYSDDEEELVDELEDDYDLHLLDDGEELVDHHDLHVLDLCPSLRTLCIVDVLRYRLRITDLPTALQDDIVDFHMPSNMSWQ